MFAFVNVIVIISVVVVVWDRLADSRHKQKQAQRETVLLLTTIKIATIKTGDK